MLVDRVARAMLRDELTIDKSKRDFGEVWEDEGAIWLQNAQAAIAAILQEYAIVPKEPTEAMWVAGAAVIPNPRMIVSAYCAMIAAAPKLESE